MPVSTELTTGGGGEEVELRLGDTASQGIGRIALTLPRLSAQADALLGCDGLDLRRAKGSNQGGVGRRGAVGGDLLARVPERSVRKPGSRRRPACSEAIRRRRCSEGDSVGSGRTGPGQCNTPGVTKG